jgi:biotin synthase
MLPPTLPIDSFHVSLTPFPSCQVITTRSYSERLNTIENVRNAGISVCSGGIIGLGEQPKDRVGLIWEMSQLPEPPESFPVNALVPIEGTPLGDKEQVKVHDMLRTIATARIVLPTCVTISPFLVYFNF